MKVGTFAYPIQRGLGHLAKEFYDHGIITDVLKVKHASIPSTDWYPNSPEWSVRSKNYKDLFDFCDGKDLMLFFETPFHWPVINHCKTIGVKTVLLTMYECTPKVLPAIPDLFLCPSLLDLKYFPFYRSVFLPLPISDKVKWKQRETAEFFIHNGGYLGLRGREGTTLLIEAMQYVKSPIKLRIRVQENVSQSHQRMCSSDKRIEYEANTFPYEELFSDGDCYVAPQKFNGCSLPLQEAYASGLCCITTNRYPMNTWLPTQPMIPVQSYSKASIGASYNIFDEANINRLDIASTIDALYGKDISYFSLMGNGWAKHHSWEVLKPRYEKILQKVLTQEPST